jgi:uncharacterized repeat protein (TIGR03803 family)
MKFLVAVTAAFITLLSFTVRSSAQTETVLYAFRGGSDGATPSSTLTPDSDGNLFGTTFAGGASGIGTVYELSPNSGSWNETVLFSFNGTNGYGPESGVIFDSEGNLYGSTISKGKKGYGTVYELKRSTQGVWRATVLHNFGGGEEGEVPEGNLVFDNSGNLYGTTFYGGKYGKGTAWELSRTDRGTWAFKNLHTFGGGSDGENPYAGIILDASGNAYGTTWIGGADNAGVVFELIPTSTGPWQEQILYNFSGAGSIGGLIFDSKGNLYGTTFDNLVFELTPSSDQEWIETTLAAVANSPESTLAFDSEGDLYGTTLNGGNAGMGSVFELSRGAGGVWNQRLLHSFTGDDDGSRADVGITLDSEGNVYGTTYAGGGTGCGGSGCGVVFRVN